MMPVEMADNGYPLRYQKTCALKLLLWRAVNERP